MTTDHGKLIRDARKKTGYSQDKLAAEVGVSRKTINDWENHGVRPSAVNAAALCQALPVLRVEDLIPADDMETLGTIEHQPASFPVSKEAMEFAMLWDQLPPESHVKALVKQSVESEHKSRFPDFWRWTGDARPRPAGRGNVKSIRKR